MIYESDLAMVICLAITFVATYCATRFLYKLAVRWGYKGDYSQWLSEREHR